MSSTKTTKPSKPSILGGSFNLLASDYTKWNYPGTKVEDAHSRNRRWAQTVKIIQDSKADYLCCQEVTKPFLEYAFGGKLPADSVAVATATAVAEATGTPAATTNAAAAAGDATKTDTEKDEENSLIKSMAGRLAKDYHGVWVQRTFCKRAKTQGGKPDGNAILWRKAVFAPPVAHKSISKQDLETTLTTCQLLAELESSKAATNGGAATVSSDGGGAAVASSDGGGKSSNGVTAMADDVDVKTSNKPAGSAPTSADAVPTSTFVPVHFRFSDVKAENCLGSPDDPRNALCVTLVDVETGKAVINAASVHLEGAPNNGEIRERQLNALGEVLFDPLKFPKAQLTTVFGDFNDDNAQKMCTPLAKFGLMRMGMNRFSKEPKSIVPLANEKDPYTVTSIFGEIDYMFAKSELGPGVVIDGFMKIVPEPKDRKQKPDGAPRESSVKGLSNSGFFDPPYHDKSWPSDHFLLLQGFVVV